MFISKIVLSTQGTPADSTFGSRTIEKKDEEWYLVDNRLSDSTNGYSLDPDTKINFDNQITLDDKNLNQEKFEEELYITLNKYLDTEKSVAQLTAYYSRANKDANEDAPAAGSWGGASDNKIFILSRWRKIYIVDKKKKIVYKGDKILLSEAKKMEKRIERDKKKRKQ